MKRILAVLACLVAVYGDRHVRRRYLQKVSNGTQFSGTLELLIEMNNDVRRRLGTWETYLDIFDQTYAEHDEVESDNSKEAVSEDANSQNINAPIPKASIIENVTKVINEDSLKNAIPVPTADHFAFGSDALQAFIASIRGKINKDDDCMMGVTVSQADISHQVVMAPNEFDGTRRHLVNWSSFTWVNLLSRLSGQCQFCNVDNNDGRMLSVSKNNEYSQGRRKLQNLESNTDMLEQRCQKLAKKILSGAGRRYPLLSLIDRIGMKITNPNFQSKEPIIVWWPSSPEDEN